MGDDQGVPGRDREAIAGRERVSVRRDAVRAGHVEEDGHGREYRRDQVRACGPIAPHPGWWPAMCRHLTRAPPDPRYSVPACGREPECLTLTLVRTLL